MDKNIANLFSESLAVSPDCLAVYLILRSDIARNETPTARILKPRGKLVSGLDVNTISHRINLPSLSVLTCIDRLKQVGWVKETKLGFDLGTIEDFEATWYCSHSSDSGSDSKPEIKKSDSIKERILQLANERKKKEQAEKREKISSKLKQKIASDSLSTLVRPEKAATKVLNYLSAAVKNCCGATLEYNNRTKYVYAGRFLSWCSEDLDGAYKLIDWTIENWEELKVVLVVESEYPTLNIFSTKSIFTRLAKYVVEGIPTPKPKIKVDATGMATRANKKEIENAKDEGW